MLKTLRLTLDRLSSRQPAHSLQTAFSYERQLTADFAGILERLHEAGLGAIALRDHDGQRRHIGILREEAAPAASVLKKLRPEDGWEVKGVGDAGWLVRRRYRATNGRLIPGALTEIAVALWSEVTGRGATEGTRRSRWAKYANTGILTRQDWEALASYTREGRTMLRPLQQPAGRIDMVYTWVDADDPQWRAQRDAALPAAGEVHATALDEARYANSDELRYSLRSVEMFADWVNHIYLVTAGRFRSGSMRATRESPLLTTATSFPTARHCRRLIRMPSRRSFIEFRASPIATFI